MENGWEKIMAALKAELIDPDNTYFPGHSRSGSETRSRSLKLNPKPDPDP
jgi:hypothetical protein